MEREPDIWLAPYEQALFNADAENHNSRFLPLIHTDLYLSAFTSIHRRHNPLIPQWVVECSASDFVSAVAEQWDSHAAAAAHQNPQDMNEKRFMVIGAARRLCSLPLRMEGSLRDEGYISTAQKRGLLYHIRTDTPSLQMHVVQRYDGIDAANRLEGAEVLSILAQLFATLGVNPPDFSDIPLRQYLPYKRPPPLTNARLNSPDRRLCSSLAYTVFNVRLAKAKGDHVKLPFGLLGGEQSDDSVIPFSKEDFRQRAQVNDSKNPLQVAMSGIAGKLCEFKDLGRSVGYFPGTCEHKH
jgi:hypothetical protein